MSQLTPTRLVTNADDADADVERGIRRVETSNTLNEVVVLTRINPPPPTSIRPQRVLGHPARRRHDHVAA